MFHCRPSPLLIPSADSFQIYGSEGNLISGNPRKSALTLNGSKQLDDIHYSFKSRYTEAYKVELDHFVEMVRGMMMLMKYNNLCSYSNFKIVLALLVNKLKIIKSFIIRNQK